MGAVGVVVVIVVVLPGLFLATGAVVCAALGVALSDPAERRPHAPRW